MTDEVLKRMGEILELLVYPYPIEHNTIKNILYIVTGKKVDNLDDAGWKSHDILYIARMLKKGELPMVEELHGLV
ncbi:hypothetical protein LCGC14_2055090 [marine sediment metagenome]|uniref:Uncharacterized protein n=1 Tax=marine sediment metagenome TaxID=412755 RepID=A0A0F9EMZ4_9ZZZZ